MNVHESCLATKSNVIKEDISVSTDKQYINKNPYLNSAEID
jgi:hypothetical protein